MTPNATYPADGAPRGGSSSPEGSPFSEWRSEALSWDNLSQLLLVAFQVGLCVLVIWRYQIESLALLAVMILVWAGFIVHHVLPMRWRLPFFGLLSAASIPLILGPSAAVWVLGLGAVLIVMAHLPVPITARVALICLFAAGLAYLRAGNAESPIPIGVWPILGSMFMFRLMVYLYDHSKRAARFSGWHAIAYFFMVPNVCFPLFPVVDYKQFTRTYYDRESPFEIYQSGVSWIMRGIIHLILYRLVYHYVLVDSIAVESASAMVAGIVGTYLLYLNVSGTFHIAVGVLHLFGFNLWETHNNYLLSSSFTDFWRRINIYWKDFMQKLFFNPLYLKFSRRIGVLGAMAAATVISFTITWLLHSYQYFWIRGEFPIQSQDIIFWYALAVMLFVNMVVETRKGRKRVLSGTVRTVRDDVTLALRTVAMFVTISILWALWTVGPSEWLLMMSKVIRPNLGEVAWILLFLVGLGAAAVLSTRVSGKQIHLGSPRPAFDSAILARSAVQIGVAGVLLLAVKSYSERPVARSMAPRVATVLDNASMRNRLNAQDREDLRRGYYEDLAELAPLNSVLASISIEEPAGWYDNPAQAFEGDTSAMEILRPNAAVIFKGVPFTTNRWGFRDKDYELEVPAGTYRIALLGMSVTEGSGVADDEIYHVLVEDRLNAEYASAGQRFEVLNFGVGGYGPLHRLIRLEDLVLRFQPDLLILVAHGDPVVAVDDIVLAVRGRASVPQLRPARMLLDALPYADSLVSALDIDRSVTEIEIRRRLQPYQDELARRVYARIRDLTEPAGIAIAVTEMPLVETFDADFSREMDRWVELLRETGYPYLDLLDVWEPDPSRYWLVPWDHHPSAEGHRILADRFYQELVEELPLLAP